MEQNNEYWISPGAAIVGALLFTSYAGAMVLAALYILEGGCP